MTEYEYLIDFHQYADRQGPGSPEDTLKALNFIPEYQHLPLQIADIGCGSGGQTITLAQHTKSQIIAVDLFPQMLEALKLRINALGLDGKITTLAKSMDDLPFQAEAFDIIWSEGAIYSMGFEAGIRYWSTFIKPGGYLAVSEVIWLTNNRPKEIEAFWHSSYPEINTAAHKMRQLEENGYSPVGFFVLPPDRWINNYHKPMEARFAAFLDKHQHAPLAQKIVAEHQEEIRLYHAYQAYYSYAFYVAKKG